MWQDALSPSVRSRRSGTLFGHVITPLFHSHSHSTHTHIHTRACLMSAKEPGGEWGCCKINFLIRETDHNSSETKHLGKSGDRWGGGNARNSPTSLFFEVMFFANLSLKSFPWCIFPVFERLHINRGWQAAMLSCWRQCFKCGVCL